MLAEFYPLMRIVFPDDDFKAQEELFYRASNRYGFAGKHGKRCDVLSFDTWMNLFASKKWYTYCSLGDLYLEIEAKGECEVIVTGHYLNSAFGVISETIQSIFCDFGEEPCKQRFLIGDVKNYDGVSFEISMPEHGHSEFYGAAWGTDYTSMRKHTLAIVTCTFKRERYIRKTMQKFADFLQKNPALRERIHLYVVDNGRTLEDNGQDENISIIPNKNAGGAGGFARGLMCANDEGYTRCLFMDDDVEIVPETFYRTLVLIDYFKDEYKDAFVNGPMMNIYDKYEMFENLAVYNDDFWVRPYHAAKRVDCIQNVLCSIDVDEHVFHDKWVDSAWWYSCFSLDQFRDEYPVPVFFRGDDVEWAWRKHGNLHISINGICVWHMPFLWRVGKSTEFYYLPRNMIFITALYGVEEKEAVMTFLRNRLMYLLDIWDYTSADLLVEGVKDCLKGYRVFEEDPEKQFKRIKKIEAKTQQEREYDDRTLEIIKCGNADTLNLDEGVSMGLYPNPTDFLGQSKVRVYNLDKKVYEIRKKDIRREESIRDRFFALNHILDDEYEKLVEDFKAGHCLFKTRRFWNKYLDLEAEV